VNKKLPQKLADIGGSPVYCRHDKVLHPDEIRFHPDNPNQHPPEQIEVYLEVVRINGFRRAAVISNRSGCLTRGHGLVLAARHGLLPGVPVEYQDYDTEADEIADLVADNRLARLSKFDNKKLTELLLRLDDGTQDMRRTGYLEEDLEDLMCKAGTLPEPRLSDDDTTLPPPGTASDVSNMPISHVRMVQLFLNEQTMPEFLGWCEKLKGKYKTSNVTDTVYAALKEAVERL
jgi:hypothetical protein